MTDTAERISNAIKQKGLSYAQLEKISGVSKSALQRYATGKTKKIPIDVMERIASALSTTLAYLMGWTDDMEIPSQSFELMDELRNASGTIAQNIKKMRDKLQISSTELAKKAHLPLTIVEQYEAGATAIEPNELRLIADALEISIAALTEIAIPYYYLSDEGRAFLYHNAPTPEEMGEGFPYPYDEATNKLIAKVLKMTSNQREQLLDFLVAFKIKDD